MELKQNEGRKKIYGTYAAILIPLGVAINYIGSMTALALTLPFFLDSIGTIIVAAIMGPWIGAISGFLYNLIMAMTQGDLLQTLFGLCNVATGVIVGYAVRRGKFKTIWNLVLVTLLVTITNTIIGSAVAVYIYGGIAGGTGGHNVLVGLVLATVKDVFSAQLLTSFPINLVDKGFGIAIGWIILSRLPDNMKTLSGAKLEDAPGKKTVKSD